MAINPLLVVASILSGGSFNPSATSSVKEEVKKKFENPISLENTNKGDNRENYLLSDTKKIREFKYKANEASKEETKWKEIWKFFSLFEEKSKTIKEVVRTPATSYRSSNHEKIEENQLTSEAYRTNNAFWSLQQSRFGKISNSEAYGNENTITGYSDVTVYKYCSLKGSKTQQL